MPSISNTNPLNGLYSATLLQEQLQILSKVNPNNVAYNIPFAIELTGYISKTQISRTLDLLVLKHDALRTVFDDSKSGLKLRILNPTDPRLPRLQHKKCSGRIAAMNIAQELAELPFLLESVPLFRPQLVQYCHTGAILLLTMHHTIGDGESQTLIFNDFCRLYQITPGESTNKETSVAHKASKKFAEYCHWIREIYPLTPSRQKDETFWTNNFPKGLTWDVGLPGTKLQCLEHAPISRKVSLSLPRVLCQKIDTLARREGTTAFQVILSCFLTTLGRLSLLDDFVVGLTVDHRSLVDCLNVVGFYTAALPLRFDSFTKLSLREALIVMRKRIFGLILHSLIPTQTIANLLLVKRPGFEAPFGINIVQSTLRSEALRLGNVSARPFLVRSNASKFETTVFISTVQPLFTLSFEYRMDRLTQLDIDRFFSSLCVVARQIANDPLRCLGSLRLVGERYRQKAICEWNATFRKYPREVNLLDRFRFNVRESPDTIAIVFKTEALSYRDLDTISNRFGNRIKALGVKKGSLVGICCERNVDMIIAILGVLKAGAAYVPMDPKAPEIRLLHVLNECRPDAVCCSRDRQTVFEGLFIGPLISLAPLSREVLDESSSECNVEATGDALAYVMFTSGSTGGPKGVMCTHKGLLNRLQWMEEYFDVGKHDNVLQKANFTFDVSVWEIFLPLRCGAKLVLTDDNSYTDCQALASIIVSQRITILHFVPSMLRVFLDLVIISNLKSLVHVICSGEELTPELVRMFYSKAHDRVQLYNLYGPTEASIDVSAHKCARRLKRPRTPIGRPIANTQLYILDREMELVPVGCVGELYIGGVSLAKGYIAHQELTNKSFLQSPFIKNDKLYKTGDLAQYTNNGEIEFIGRVDRQLKLHGIRLDPGEVETALLKHPKIQDVAVDIKDLAGRRHLVAFIVFAGKVIDTTALRCFLETQLPPSLIPSKYVRLEHLPRTSSGKLDRSKLGCHLAAAVKNIEENECEANVLEEIFAQIWRTILGLKDINLTDSFFDIGGDSMKSIIVVHSARQHGVAVSVADILRCRTIKKLAKTVLDGMSRAKSIDMPQKFQLVTSNDVSRLPSCIEDAFPASRLQAGLIFESLRASGNYRVYVTTVEIASRFAMDSLQKAINTVVSQQPMLRTFFDLGNYSEVMQVVRKRARITVDVVDWRSHTRTIQHRLLKRWRRSVSVRKFSWNNCPLVKITVHRLAKKRFYLTLVEPFLDGWSVALLIRAIIRQYIANILFDGIVGYKASTREYAYYVSLEQESANDSACTEFWARQADKLPPTCLGGQTVCRKGQLARINTRFDHRQSQALRDKASEYQIPLKSLLLAIYLRVLGALLRKSSVTCGLMCNGRPETEGGETLIGLFLNVLPLAVNVDQNLEAVARAVLEAEVQYLPFRRYPYSHLMQQNPSIAFDSVFNFTHFRLYGDLQSEHLRVLSVEGTDQTYFNLTVQAALNWKRNQVRIVWEYRTDRIQRSTVWQLSSTFRNEVQHLMNNVG